MLLEIGRTFLLPSWNWRNLCYPLPIVFLERLFCIFRSHKVRNHLRTNLSNSPVYLQGGQTRFLIFWNLPTLHNHNFFVFDANCKSLLFLEGGYVIWSKFSPGRVLEFPAALLGRNFYRVQILPFFGSWSLGTLFFFENGFWKCFFYSVLRSEHVYLETLSFSYNMASESKNIYKKVDICKKRVFWEKINHFPLKTWRKQTFINQILRSFEISFVGSWPENFS